MACCGEEGVMKLDDMVYVAADPKQLGTAYALIVDDGADKVYLRKTLAKWRREGAITQHVTRADGVAMLDKWIPPKP